MKLTDKEKSRLLKFTLELLGKAPLWAKVLLGGVGGSALVYFSWIMSHMGQ